MFYSTRNVIVWESEATKLEGFVISQFALESDGCSFSRTINYTQHKGAE